jgi:hypothetical protein
MAETGSPASTGPDPTLTQTLTSLEASLHTGRPPRSFSEESLGVLFERQSEYVEELGIEAIRLARRARADVVSASDVEHADEIVRSAERSQRNRIYETVGGILLGGGLGQLYAQIALGKDATNIGWIVAILSGVVGLVLLTYAFARR